MQTANEKEEALIADEKLLMELSRIVYREKFSENLNVKNYKIAHHLDFYYMDESLINAQNAEAEDQEEEQHTEEQHTEEQTSQEVATEEQPVEEQTFCIYDEVCSQQKMCGDCAMDEYEREQYEEGCENFKMDRKIDCHDE